MCPIYYFSPPVKECPVVVPPEHGSVSCTDSYRYLSKCSYLCDVGFGISDGGSRVRVCNSTGGWVGAAPTCVGKHHNLMIHSLSLYICTSLNIQIRGDISKWISLFVN